MIWQKKSFQLSDFEFNKLNAFPATILGVSVIFFSEVLYADFYQKKLAEHGLLQKNHALIPDFDPRLVLRIWVARILGIKSWTLVHEAIYQSIHFRFKEMELDMHTDELFKRLVKKDLLVLPGIKRVAESED